MPTGKINKRKTALTESAGGGYNSISEGKGVFGHRSSRTLFLFEPAVVGNIRY